MRKKIIVKEPLSKFLGAEKIADMKGLLIAMNQAVDKAGINGVNVFFPGVCDLETIYSSYQFMASVDFAKKKRIDMEKMLEKLIPLVQKEYGVQFGKNTEPIFVNFRFQKHAVLITNGHLERDGSNQAMPMHVILDPFDRRTFVRTLRTYRKEEGEIGDHENGRETISDLLNPRNFQKGDVVEGLYSQAASWINREKTKGQVGEALGLNVIFKDSSGQINGGEKDFCLATRTCVHSEEINQSDLTAKVVETYKRMKKLRENPSCILGIEDRLEIHMDSRRITITCASEEKGKRFVSFLTKLLEFLGIQDLDSANVRYKKDITVDDPLWLKAGSAVVEVLANALEFLGQEKVKAGIYLLMLLIGTPLFVAIALYLNHSIFKTAILILPAALVFTVLVRDSSEKDWLMKIGQPENVVLSGLVLFVSGFVYDLAGFAAYFAILVVVAAVIALSKISDKINPEESEIWKKISCKIDAFCVKLLSNSVANIIIAILAITLGIMGFAVFGILVAFAVIPIAILAFIAILADKKFWSEMEYEKERYNDRFFSNFKQARPGLTEDCEIRLKKTRCLKLWIWIPVKVFFRELVEFGKNKYPTFLTITGIKGNYTKLVKKQVARFGKPNSTGGVKS